MIELIYLTGLVIIVGILFLLYSKKEQEKLQEIKELKNQLLKSERECLKLKKSSTAEYSNNNTSFITAEIKKRERLEEEILKLKSTVLTTKSIAYDASMAKSEFLSNIRHEIRTPLNSILVFADLLEKNIEDKKLNSFALNINNSGQKLLSLMDNIIELSAIESGSFVIEESAVDTREYLNSIVEPFKSRVSKKRLECSIDIDKKLPESLMLDSIRVKEIVDNLIENAIKFTDSGYIKISVVTTGNNSANNTVDISILVEDSGHGIDKQNQDKIFKIFEKKDNCSAIEFEGTGLGLSINRKLASLMNGTLEVQSIVSKGSVFTLNLKGVEVVLHATYNEEDHTSIDFNLISPNGATILVIDAKEDSRTVISESFSVSNVKVVDFDNARSAVEFLQKEEVDLIFIDVEMLSIDDGAVSQVIKSLSSANVVTLTNSRLKGINFGVGGVKPVGHLLKPILKTALFKIALKVLNGQRVIIKEDVVESSSSDNPLNIENLKLFLIKNEESLNNLYLKALKTNDLNAIRRFADATLEIALESELDDIANFCELLIDKVDLFEIDSINDMLKLYESKIKRYKSFIKE